MTWTKCLTEFETKQIQLPLPKIKVFEGKKYYEMKVKTLQLITTKDKFYNQNSRIHYGMRITSFNYVLKILRPASDK